MVWSSALVCGAPLSQQWSGACLNDTLTVLDSTLLGVFDKCLGSLDASVELAQAPMGGTWLFCLTALQTSVEFPQEPVCGWSCSADTANLTTCAGILNVSPCQMC